MNDLDQEIPSLIKKPNATQTAPAGSRAALRAQEKAKLKAAAQQRLLFIFLGAAIFVNIIFGYFLYDIMVKKTSQQNAEQLIESEIDTAITNISAYLRSNQEKLDKLAHQQDIVLALSTKNKDNFQSLAKAFSVQFTDVLDLKILIAGEADVDVDPKNEVPIRFAELDLIRRAENRMPHMPEAAQINEKWLIHMVSAVDAETGGQPTQTVLGTLMLTLDAKELKKILSSSDKNFGAIILQQKFSGSAPQNIAQFGMGNSDLSKEKPIQGSNWQIQFKASENLFDSATEPPSFWIFVVGCTTSLSLLLTIILSRFLVKHEKEAHEQLAPTPTETNKNKTVSSPEKNAPSTLYQNQDILDVPVFSEDENILGLSDTSKKKQSSAAMFSEHEIPVSIFRSYDIRGVVGTDLTVLLAERIGQAVGSEALDQGEQHLIVARDARTHSEELTNGLIKGILSSGCHVINIGVVPTPLMYFATYHFNNIHSGVMVTASHNPAEYNGFKIVINNNTLADDAILKLRTRILTNRVHQGQGEESFREIIPQYIERIFSDVALANNISIVIDAGNAVTGVVAPQLFEELGCTVTKLFCDLDGTFPNHEPDPTQEKNLRSLIATVQDVKADIGVAFDGDGDRLVVVTPKGHIIWPDRLLMLFAKDVLARNPGADVLFDVKCSRQLNQIISSYGGRPIMWKTGHSPMKAKMIETGAIIGGEYSGHIFIKDRWYGFDDGIYAMARLLEIITLRDQNIDDIFESFPQLISTSEIKIIVPDDAKFEFMDKLREQGKFDNGNIVTIDGIRVDYSKGWGLVRASNTSPALTLRFEAETDEAMESIKKIFRRELLKLDNNLALTF